MADENISEHQFLWEIENFSACVEDTSYYLRSPMVRAVDLDDSCWNVVLAPRGDTDDRFVSVMLIRSSRDDGPAVLHLELELCLIDVNGEERFKQCASFECEENASSAFSEFVRRSDIFEDKDTFLPNDILTLLIRARKSDSGEFSAKRSVVRTKILVNRSSFIWMIRGLTRKASANQKLFFMESGLDRNCMELACVYVNTINHSKSTGNKHLIRLSFRPKYVSEVQTFVSVKIHVLGSHPKPHTTLETKRNFEAGSTYTLHLPSFDISDRMESLLEEDHLGLAFDFCISEESHDKQREATLIPLADKFSEGNALQQDMKSVYESAILVKPDIQLIVCNEMQCIWAHKFILGARSLVFREVLNRFAMEKKGRFDLMVVNANNPVISNNVCVRHEVVTVYGDNGTDCADILTISLNTLEHMLKCMYTDTLNPDDENSAIHLYSAGVMFDFRLLREKSEYYLKSHISLKSFYAILEFAKLKGMVELKKKCVNFIVNNWESILASDDWVVLREVHEDLAEEILDILKSLRQ